MYIVFYYSFLSRFGAFLESSLIFAKKSLFWAFLKTIRTNSTAQWIACKSL